MRMLLRVSAVGLRAYASRSRLSASAHSALFEASTAFSESFLARCCCLRRAAAWRAASRAACRTTACCWRSAMQDGQKCGTCGAPLLHQLLPQTGRAVGVGGAGGNCAVRLGTLTSAAWNTIERQGTIHSRRSRQVTIATPSPKESIFLGSLTSCASSLQLSLGHDQFAALIHCRHLAERAREYGLLMAAAQFGRKPPT